MKILVISNYFAGHEGGIEYVAFNLVSFFRRKNSVHWVACEVKKLSTKDYSRENIPLEANNFAEDKLGFPYPLLKFRTISILFKEVAWCDIIHLHDCLYMANVVAFIFSRVLKKPVLITQHVSPIHYSQPYKNILQWIAYRLLGRFVLENSELVVFVSKRVQNWFLLRMRLSGKVLLITNGVDFNLFYPASPIEKGIIRQKLKLPLDKPILLFVGRFTEKKGLKIIQQVAIHENKYMWVLIGRKGDQNPLKWNIDNVVVLPPVSQESLRNYYIAADFLVLPSTGEGLPLVVQEAMRCGTPAIISNETKESLSDAPVVTLQSLDSSNLAFSLDQFMTNSSMMKDLRIRVFDYSANMQSWENVAGYYESLFSELVKSEPSSNRRCDE